jgi:osmotically-inducible protein OsmY
MSFSKATFTLLCTLPLLQGCIAAAVGAAATTGYVAVQERTAGTAIDDTTIWAKVKEKFVQNNIQELLTGVNVEVIEGRVHLTGSVTSPETRIEAIRLTWQVRGVKEVINEIEIVEMKDKKLSDIANDSWISTQVRSKMLFNKDIRSINFSIDVVRGNVYLMGIARTQEELDALTEVASSTPGVNKVVSYVRVENNVGEDPTTETN